jgi:UPF0755 protein
VSGGKKRRGPRTPSSRPPPKSQRPRPQQKASGGLPSWAPGAIVVGAAVRSATLFSWYLRLFGDASKLKPGAHLVPDDLSAGELIAMLERSGSKREKVTFPEGWTRFDMARRLEEKRIAAAARFLEATTDRALLTELGITGESAEGYLFPATYQLALDADPRDVVRRLKGEMDARMDKIRAAHPELPGPQIRELGWTPHEVVVLASLVEKEAVVDDERPLVASALINRFRDPAFTPKPPRLQSDPSAAYGCLVYRDRIKSCIGFANNKITPEMNADPENPYSTYSHAGLPPGPIANPGEKSLSAAFLPADTKYLYFVAKGGGRHTFSATLEQHNAAVRHLRTGQ